jgi:hypothetical protein
MPPLCLAAFAIVRGARHREERAIISAGFIIAISGAFFTFAFIDQVMPNTWVFAGMVAGWLYGSVCGAWASWRDEKAGLVFGVGFVAAALGIGSLWLDFGALWPPWVLASLHALSAFAIIAGATGRANVALRCGIAGTVLATASYVVGFWGVPEARLDVFVLVALGLLLAGAFAAPARLSRRPVTRFLVIATASTTFVAGVAWLFAGSMPFYVPATPLFLVAVAAVLIGSARHENVGIVGGAIWALVAGGGYWRAFATAIADNPVTSASIAANASLLVALASYRLWVGRRSGAAGRAPASAWATQPGAWSADRDPAVRSQRDDILRKTREAWEERKRTLAAADPVWQEARLFQWVQQHLPTFWTCSTEWREVVMDATCPVCGTGFGLRPQHDEEEEEAPAFVCGNAACRAVLHKRCLLQARGMSDTCPGIPGCTSSTDDGFRTVYRYAGEGGPSGYRTLPQIRARASEAGISGWEHMKRVQLVREIQNAEGHRACFGKRPDACPETDCVWRTNCLCAHVVERWRRTLTVEEGPSKPAEHKTSVLELKSASSAAAPPVPPPLQPRAWPRTTADSQPPRAWPAAPAAPEEPAEQSAVSELANVPNSWPAFRASADAPDPVNAWTVREEAPEGPAAPEHEQVSSEKPWKPYRPTGSKPKTIPGLPAPWWKNS